MLPLTLLALSLDAAALPVDLDLRAFGGAGGAIADSPTLDGALMGGLMAVGWARPGFGIGGRVALGSYGVTYSDEPNLFGFLVARAPIAEGWTGGLELGTNLGLYQSYCVRAPCAGGPWSERRPIGALALTREHEVGGLRLPVGLRVEVGAERWAAGLEVGLGLGLGR